MGVSFGCNPPLSFFCLTTDPPGAEMYVEVGKTKSGLTLWRCKRISSKDEAANLVMERSLHTTAKMNELTATGQSQGRHSDSSSPWLPRVPVHVPVLCIQH